jgi:hypothetical protein
MIEMAVEDEHDRNGSGHAGCLAISLVPSHVYE